MNALERVIGRSVTRLTRIACWLALVGLALISCSIIWPRPLPVILAMSGGHAIGVLAFVCYLGAIVLDQRRRPPGAGPSTPPDPPAQNIR